MELLCKWNLTVTESCYKNVMSGKIDWKQPDNIKLDLISVVI